ncbi:MAG: LuxR C-terminal-related transcriptional regulator [Pigmentiphaga sp.]
MSSTPLFVAPANDVFDIVSSVSLLIQCIGSDDFERQMISVVGSLIDHDHLGCHVFAVHCEDGLKFDSPLFVHSHDGTNNARMAAHNYMAKWWQDDPDMIDLARGRPGAVLPYFSSVLPTAEVRSQGYVRECAELCNVGERIAFTYGHDRYRVSLRLYRRRGSRALNQEQYGRLHAVGEMLSALCFKQWESLGSRVPRQMTAIERLASRATELGASLSRREMQVVEGMLDGLTAAQIASLLSISHTTVVTLRSRAYLKLNFRTALEMFRYCMAT